MNSSLVDGVSSKSVSELLPRDRTILERPMMEFRPFGLDEQGQTIRDLSGMSIRAIVLYLERTIVHQQGTVAGREVLQELCRCLNQRIRDPVYHVTPEFLKNAWNSYSYEFAIYLYEFCEHLSGDPGFLFQAGMEKASPVMQVLARPFSIEQIYGMFPYFGDKFASGSIECRVVEIHSGSATLAMRFSSRTLRQFGPFKRRCAHLVCQSAQGILAAVPARVHGLPPARLTEASCIAADHDWCQWIIQWQGEGSKRWGRRRRRNPMLWTHGLMLPSAASSPALTAQDRQPDVGRQPSRDHGSDDTSWWRSQAASPLAWFVGSGFAGLILAVGIWMLAATVDLRDLLLAGLVPLLASGLCFNRSLGKESAQREALIQEQISFVESRHEELREAYLEQEQTRVELRRKVTQLTALHRAGLLFSSTLDRATLIQQVLETLIRDLHYDRAMISLFDPARRLLAHTRILGVSPDVQAFAETCHIPVTDASSPEGTVVLEGRPLLIEDIRTVWATLHPLNQRLAEMSKTQTLIVVPLKTNDRVVGTLTVDRTHQCSLTQDDVELMTTLGNQVATALDNAAAYQQIEEWNAGLELKVRERTAALEQADQLRAQFLSHVSHELKTPLTSIKGFLQNLLDGLTGPLNEKQQRYLSRMQDNADRLIRMIEDLLDRTSIDAGRVDLLPVELDMATCLVDAIEQLRPLAQAKGQRLDVRYPAQVLTAWADRDRLIQVIVNLVQNAIKYTPSGGAITVGARAVSPSMARVSIRDTGPGIPLAYVDKIFDPFFRVEHGQRSGPKGLGLGLSIVKSLVELQGGQVAAANRPEGGAEMSFTVPIRSPLTREETSLRAGRTIVVIDDDPDIRQLLMDRLYTQGYQPIAVTGCRLEVQTVQGQEWGGVILDIDHMDGLEVLEQLRQHHRDLPVILTAASGSQELAVRAMGMGAQAYLLKPFEADALHQTFQTWFPAR